MLFSGMQCACGLYYSEYLILLPIRIISPSEVETLKMRAGSLVYSEIKSAEETGNTGKVGNPVCSTMGIRRDGPGTSCQSG